MDILLLRGFNNYFNRIVKKYTTLADYKTNSASFLEFTGINFNPNDGVVAELILGSPAQQESSAPLAWDILGTPDYLICSETSNGTTIIKFRWFVLESERTRDGQYRLALKRDVLAENFDEVMSAPCYVEKGIITDTTDPLLMNSEGSRVNQIKQNETLLKDATKCAWLVGYLKKDYTPSGTISATPKSAILDVDVLTNMSDLPDACITYKNASGTTTQQATKTAIIENNSQIYMTIYFAHGSYMNAGLVSPATVNSCNWQIEQGGMSDTALNNWHSTSHWGIQNTNVCLSVSGEPEAMCNNIRNYTNSDSNIKIKWNNLINACHDATVNAAGVQVYTSDSLAKYNGKYFRKDNILYKLSISVSSSNSYSYENAYNANGISSYNTEYFTVVANKNGNYSADSSSTNNNVSYSLNGRRYTIIAQEAVVAGTVSVTIPAHSSRRTLDDELFDIFAIPFIPENDETTIKFANNVLDSNVSLLMAQKIMTTAGLQTGGNAYDLQLLPYCPINLSANSSNNIALTSLTENVDYTWITDQDSHKKSIVFFPAKANFTKNISLEKDVVGIDRQKNIDETYSSVNAVLDSDNITYKVETTVTSLHPHIERPLINLPKGFKYIKDYKIYINDQLETNAVLTIGSIVMYGWGTIDDSYSFKVSNITSISSAQSVKLRVVATIIYESAVNALDYKISNECDFMRLTSPNFNGMFEFKLSKFENGIHYFNIDCTYKPFNPYIKLNPDFSGLYGADFNDSTGLILGGDFSLSILTNPWTEYQLANKNYQNIFNRQIQNLDVSQQIAREQMQFSNTVGIITGTVGGGIGGAATGGKLGPIGAVVGGMLGTTAGAALSAFGASKNEEWLARQQQEARNYSIDMYNYQLGNIQALPQSITKSDPITYNNKVWPILEEFSCTDAEKEVIKNKIEYDGMTIMAIGSLGQYSVSEDFDKAYVKGQLIRCESINDDFHIIDAIYQEVNKGFYIPQ